ncbi:Fe-S cluster assembly protein SufB [PVC group bacterium]|nr:Fe-S cluster assembly protein SufB [PVC group bacterium]
MEHPSKKTQTEVTISENQLAGDYKFGFTTDVETEDFPKGINEGIIRLISEKRNEPEFMLEFRLKAFRHWETLEEPHWAHLYYPKIDYQAIRYYSAVKKKEDGPKSLDEVDPEVVKTFERLGIPVQEQKRLSGVAVDAVFDSISMGTTHQDVLAKAGVIFCSFSEAIQKHPELIQKYLGSVVPYTDNFFAALNAAVFSDGSFCYIPKGVRSPLELSTYFRINAMDTGQFERTLIVAEEASYVSYLEGCTAPSRDENQLHAAVVELITMKHAEIKYSTVQNWYSGDKDGKGGIFNFVTKRGKCVGAHSKISWTQVEAGAAITWKYPSVILQGDYSIGEFYSVALTNNKMQADTGTKMIHVGKNTRSKIISKGISCDQSVNSYRGLVKILSGAENARNYSNCDSMLVGDQCSANTFPYLEINNNTATVEHEATTSKINAEQIFYLKSRGLDDEEAISLLINGYCKDVFRELPLEFSVEAIKLLEMKLEGSVG